MSDDITVELGRIDRRNGANCYICDRWDTLHPFAECKRADCPGKQNIKAMTPQEREADKRRIDNSIVRLYQ